MDTKGEAFLSSCICGYHVYNDIWTATVGEELECAREVGNAKDRYAVSVLARFGHCGTLTTEDFKSL